MTLAEAFGRWLWRAGIGPGDWRLLCCELGRAGQAQAAARTEAGDGGARGCGGDVPGRPRTAAVALGFRLILDGILEVATASFAFLFEVGDPMGVWKICEKKFTFLTISVLNFLKKYVSFRYLLSSLKNQVLWIDS